MFKDQIAKELRRLANESNFKVEVTGYMNCGLVATEVDTYPNKANVATVLFALAEIIEEEIKNPGETNE